MKITKAMWRELRVFNPHGIMELSPEPRVMVGYSPQENGRAYKSPSWKVHRFGYRTDPYGAHWRDNGNKTFDIFRIEEKSLRLEEAKAWAQDRYKIAGWERSVFGSWHPTGALAAAYAKAKAKAVS